jgi:hypothetical protein
MLMTTKRMQKAPSMGSADAATAATMVRRYCTRPITRISCTIRAARTSRRRSCGGGRAAPAERGGGGGGDDGDDVQKAARASGEETPRKVRRHASGYSDTEVFEHKREK